MGVDSADIRKGTIEIHRTTFVNTLISSGIDLRRHIANRDGQGVGGYTAILISDRQGNRVGPIIGIDMGRGQGAMRRTGTITEGPGCGMGIGGADIRKGATEVHRCSFVDTLVSTGVDHRRYIADRDDQCVVTGVALIIPNRQDDGVGPVVNIDMLRGQGAGNRSRAVAEVPAHRMGVGRTGLRERAAEIHSGTFVDTLISPGVYHRRHIVNRDNQGVAAYPAIFVGNRQSDGVGPVIGIDMARSQGPGYCSRAVTKVPTDHVGVIDARIAERTVEIDRIPFIDMLVIADADRRRDIIDMNRCCRAASEQ